MQLSNSTFIIINACITSFDGCLCMYIINMLFEIKQERLKKFALYFASFLLSGMVIFIGDIVNLTPTLIIFIFVIIKCTKGSLWKKITLSLILCCGPFSVNALCDSFLRFDIHLLRPIYWILLYLFVKKIMPEKSFDLSSAYWKILILLTLTPLGILLSIVLLHNQNTLDYAYESITTVVLLSLSALSFVGLLYTVALLAKQQKLENDNMLYEMNQTYYKNMEQQQYEIRRLRHDIANHLQIMSALPTEKMKDYLSSLNKDIALTTTVNFCGDQTVNAVLNTKILKIKDSSINFHYYLEIPNELPYEKTDVCALFSNMMDNAIEACEKIASKDNEITLEAKVGKGLLAIKIENTCINTNIENNEIKTTKLDAFHHGYGLKSIQEIVTRYHGNYELKCVDNHFFLFLYLPI